MTCFFSFHRLVFFRQISYERQVHTMCRGCARRGGLWRFFRYKDYLFFFFWNVKCEKWVSHKMKNLLVTENFIRRGFKLYETVASAYPYRWFFSLLFVKNFICGKCICYFDGNSMFCFIAGFVVKLILSKSRATGIVLTTVYADLVE